MLDGTSLATQALVIGDPPETIIPTLSIQKWVSNTDVLVNEKITVYVNITNYGRAYAFNLSIDEPIFSDWVISDLIGWDEYEWLQVGQGGSIFYQYTTTITLEGEFLIQETVIEYEDINGSRYKARSTSIALTVSEVERVAERATLDEKWVVIFQLTTGLIFIPLVVILSKRFMRP